MTAAKENFKLDEISPEAREAAERAAAAAGMPLETWLSQLIKYVSAMELSGKRPGAAEILDEAVMAAALAPQPEPRGEAPPGTTIRPNAVGTTVTVPSRKADSGSAAGTGTGTGPTEPPGALPPELLRTSNFDEAPPSERDIESAIGDWRKTGSFQPVLVRPHKTEADAYEIVSGADRWLAAKRLKMKKVPVRVEAMADEDVLRANLIERLMRSTLAPMEEARTYGRLLADTGMNVADVAKVTGRSPAHVGTMVQLLDLPEAVHEMLEQGDLTVLHARTLMAAADPEAAAREVIARRLDIYQTEQLVRASRNAPLTPSAPLGREAGAEASEAAPDEDEHEARMIEKRLSALLGMKVSIDERARHKGVLSIEYDGEAELSGLVAQLNRMSAGRRGD